MLFNRVASLIIGSEGGTGRELKDLRFAFKIHKGSTKSPNQCSLRIWNLAPTTRSEVEVIGSVVILQAGYLDDVGASDIFRGNITRALTVREGPDWITELEIQDGLLEFRDTKASVSYAKGATASQVITDLAKRLGLVVRKLPVVELDRQYVAGFAFVGRVRDALDKACEYMGWEWSIQNREVQVIKKSGVFKKTAIVLSPSTGLVGSPTHEVKTLTEKAAAKDGITKALPGVKTSTRTSKAGTQQEILHVLGYGARSLLQPTMEPGGYVQLKSKSVNGEFFRIEELDHVGDTHGPEWHTEVTLRFTS